MPNLQGRQSPCLLGAFLQQGVKGDVSVRNAIRASAFGSALSLRIGPVFRSLLLIDKVLDHPMEIRVSPSEEENVVCRDCCPAGVLAEALEIDGNVLCMSRLSMGVFGDWA